jgi:NAD(P)-dependent dehydrogenase (short-subunit alcohol dehydrogenase family)
MSTLNDKVIIVSGAARGLGEEICKILAQSDAIVIGLDIQEKLLNTVTDRIRENGKSATPVFIDLSNDRDIYEKLAPILEKHNHIDVLINNAAVDVTMPIDELTLDDWDREINVNLRAPFILSKYIFPQMKKQGGGHIVNIVSTASKRAWANATAYHASKWGLLGFSHALHVEARAFNIKVTAVIAGGMKTPFLLDRFPNIDETTLQNPANVAEVVRFVLLQPEGSVIPEIMVIPMKETSWP